MSSYEWLSYQWRRALAVVVAVAGVVLLILGWVGVSGSSLTTAQIPYIASGAVGGLFALGLAATLWLSADLRDEFLTLDEIYRFLTGERAGQEVGEGPVGAVESESALELEYVPTVPRRRPLQPRPPVSAEP
jgi:hypothetical protein